MYFFRKLIFGNFFVIHESYSVFRVVKCGLGSFDFICGLVWLIFIKIYTMEQIAVKKAVVEAVGVCKSCRRNNFAPRTSVKHLKHTLKVI